MYALVQQAVDAGWGVRGLTRRPQGGSRATAIVWPPRGQASNHTLYYFKQPTDTEARDAEPLEGCHMQLFLDNSEGAGRGAAASANGRSAEAAIGAADLGP